MSLVFNKLPDETVGLIKPGTHKLTIHTAEAVIARTGSKMLQCSYKVDDTDFKINFDNYVIKDKDGNDSNFGLAKLKKLLKAINVIPEGEFTIKTLIPLIKGKSFQAELEYDKAGKYLVLGNIDTIKPLAEYSGDTEEEITPEDFQQPEVGNILIDDDF